MRQTCETAVVTCIDFRFQRAFDYWIMTHVGHDHYDRVSLAGAVKDWDLVRPQLELARHLHEVHRFVLVNHEDCRAYGPQATRAQQEDDLRRARQLLLDTFPGITVELYYARLDGRFEPVS